MSVTFDQHKPNQVKQHASIEKITLQLRLPDGGQKEAVLDLQSGGYKDIALLALNTEGVKLVDKLFCEQGNEHSIDHMWSGFRTNESLRYPAFMVVKPVKPGTIYQARNSEPTLEHPPLYYQNPNRHARNDQSGVYIFAACGDKDHSDNSPYKFEKEK